MHPRVLTVSIAALGVVLTVAVSVIGQRTASSSTSSQADATTSIVASAQALVATLDDAARAKVQFPFDGPQKTRWSNLPSPMFPREGLRLADLTSAQRTAVM